MKVYPGIVGYWEGESHTVKGELEYLTIDGDGRIIQEILDPDKPGRIIPMRLWCRLEAGSPTSYQVYGAPTFTNPWSIQIRVMTDRLVIDRTEGMSFEYTRKAEDEIPVRFKEFISQSLEKMKQKEGEIS